MFNKTLVVAGETKTVNVPYEKTVIEKRAPTDESVRLLKDMTAEALCLVLDNLILKGNGLEASAIIMENRMGASKTIQYRMVLNGKKIEGCIDTDHRDFIVNAREAVGELLKRLSEDIAKEVVMSIGTDVIAGLDIGRK